MKLILKCHTDNEFSEGMDYAFLDLTPRLASLILRRKASFEALQSSDQMLSEIHYHDHGPVYFSKHYVDDKEEWYDTLTDIADGEDFKEVINVAAEDLEDFADRSDLDRMVINHDLVCFSAIRNTYWHTETRPIDFGYPESSVE